MSKQAYANAIVIALGSNHNAKNNSVCKIYAIILVDSDAILLCHQYEVFAIYSCS